MHLGGGHGGGIERYERVSVSSHRSWKPGESWALDLLRLACLHESDFATLCLTSVAIHPSEPFEIELACLQSALNPSARWTARKKIYLYNRDR